MNFDLLTLKTSGPNLIKAYKKILLEPVYAFHFNSHLMVCQFSWIESCGSDPNTCDFGPTHTACEEVCFHCWSLLV